MMNVLKGFCVILLLVGPTLVWGQEVDAEQEKVLAAAKARYEKEKELLKEIVPYMQKRTVGFVQFNVEHPEFPKLLDFMQGLKLHPKQDSVALAIFAAQEQEKKDIEASGISDIYYWLNEFGEQYSPQSELNVILSLKPKGTGLPYINTLRSRTGATKARRHNEMILIGSADGVKRLQTEDAAMRADLTAVATEFPDSALRGSVTKLRTVHDFLSPLIYQDSSYWTDEKSMAVLNVYHLDFAFQFEKGVLFRANFLATQEEFAKTVLGMIQEAKSSYEKDPSSPQEVTNLLSLVAFSCEGRQITATIRAETDDEVKSLQERIGKFYQWEKLTQQRRRIQGRLSQVALAASNCNDTFRRFPRDVYNSDVGRREEKPIEEVRPLLSWRVWILPFLGETALFDKFNLEEPWDSEHNKKLITRMPASLVSPHFSREATKAGKTGLVAVTGDQTLISGNKNIRENDIEDGVKNTLLFVEVKEEHGVIWTKPEDVSIGTKDLISWLQLQHELYWGIDASFYPRSFPESLSEEELKSLLIRNDGKPAQVEAPK